MKIIMLLDDSPQVFDKMASYLDAEKSIFVDAENCNEHNEYQHLWGSIREFSQSNKKVMLARFSGKPSIVSELGDVFPQMIISLSSNKNSKHYTQDTMSMFLDLLRIFRQGD